MNTTDIIALVNAGATALTPLAVVTVGYRLDRRVKNMERSIEREDRVTATRFELYREIGFQLNDVFAYFNYIGSWKEYSPVDILRRKRELDRHVHTFKPLFSPAFFEKYHIFVDAAFRTNTGWREDAKLRTSSLYRAEHGSQEMSKCFTQEDNLIDIRASYFELLDCLANNLGIEHDRDA